VNYYERHLGDYARDTAHLSLLEHGVYTLLLDRYYSTEAPIPVDQAHRVARARTREERAAVDAVLSEFFAESPEGWRNRRCDEEISRYMESEPEREQKRENAKDRQRKARERRRALFNELRSYGIVPAFEATTASLQAELSRVTAGQRHTPVTRDDTATRHQTPDTILKSKEETDHLPVIGAVEGQQKPAPAKRKKPAGAFDFTPPEWVPADAWSRFVASRALKHPLTNTAAALIVGELSKFKAAGHDPAAVLDQSVMNGWRGVFEPKAGPRSPPASGGVAVSFEGKVYSGGVTDDELDDIFGRI